MHNIIHLKLSSILLDSGQSARQGWPDALGNNTFSITTTSTLLIFLFAAYESLFHFITILHFCRRGRGFGIGGGREVDRVDIYISSFLIHIAGAKVVAPPWFFKHVWLQQYGIVLQVFHELQTRSFLVP